jgi:hypothetical protein
VNATDDSTLDYVTQPGTRTLGGDDFVTSPMKQLTDLVPVSYSYDGTELLVTTIQNDSGGPAGWLQHYTLRFSMPAAPVVTITSPADGAVSFFQTVTLAATATDAVDGDLTSQVTWTSDLDGAITSPVTLSVGTHVITASVTDSEALTGMDSISITVTDANSHPATLVETEWFFPGFSVIDTTPTNGMWVYNDITNTVTLTGDQTLDFGGFVLDMTAVVLDPGATSVTGAAFACATTVQNANLCGGYDIGVNATDESSLDYLTLPGTRTLGGDDVVTSPMKQLTDLAPVSYSYDGTELLVTTIQNDSGGPAGWLQHYTLRFSIPAAPVVTITAPAQGYTFSYAQAVTLTATATDVVDGNLASQVTWTSDLDGVITSPASLSVGTHVITASVTDSEALTGMDSISITMTDDPAPIVNITSPTSDSLGLSSDVILAVSAIDIKDGDLSGNVLWTSTIDGAITSPATLSSGVHTLIASVTDSDGNTSSAEAPMFVPDRVPAYLNYIDIGHSEYLGFPGNPEILSIYNTSSSFNSYSHKIGFDYVRTAERLEPTE